jgi:hypothetical protein
MPTNQELMQGSVFDRLILGKAEGGSINLTSTHFNNLIPYPEVLALIDLTTKHDAFLKKVNSVVRTRKKGTIPVYDLAGPVMEHVGEQDPTTITTTPTTTTVPYMTEKFRCDIVISNEDIQESKAVPGLNDIEKKSVQSFLQQLGNDVADATMNANTAFAAAPQNRLQRMYKAFDGVDVQTAAKANVVDCGGKTFAKEVFPAIYDALPWRYRRRNAGLRWWMNGRTANHWQNQLAAVGAGSALTDRALTATQIPPPMGIAPWEVPYIGENDGPTAIAPTSAGDQTTYVEFVLTTLVTAGDPESAALGVGRKFIVRHITTGIEEVCTGRLDTTLRCDSTGLFGLAAADTTANHYTVRPYDETSIYLANPKLIHLVWNGEWRSNRVWNPKLDQAEITIFLEFVPIIPVGEAIVKFTNIATPPLTW